MNIIIHNCYSLFHRMKVEIKYEVILFKNVYNVIKIIPRIRSGKVKKKLQLWDRKKMIMLSFLTIGRYPSDQFC